jgi:PAS domain S-box-containing protein
MSMKLTSHLFSSEKGDAMQRKPENHEKSWELRAKLAAMVEHSTDAVIGSDLSGIITSWNIAAENMFGYTAEKILGQSISVLLPPYRPDDLSAIYEKLKQGEITRDFETVLAGKGGEQIHVSLIVSPIRNSLGEIVGASTIARNISRRKKAEETTLMQAQILDQIHESVITTDLDGYITCWNKGAEKTFLYTSDDMLGKHISLIYPEDERDVLQQRVIAPLKEKGRHETEVQLVRKNGERFFALLLLTLLRDKHGAVTGMLGSSVDITERRKAEEELKASEEQFRLIYEKSPLGIAFVNAEGLITSCNDKFVEIAGATREQLIGFNLKTGVRDDKVRSAVDRALAGELATYEGDYVTATGSRKIAMRNIYSPLYAKSGLLRGIMLVAEDITERKRLDEQLRRQIERFDLVAAGARDGIWDWDVPNKRVFFSSRWKAMRGFSDEEVGDSEVEWSGGIHPEDAPRVFASVQAHFEDKTPWFSEDYRVRRKDGSWMWIHDRGLALKDPEGRVIRMSGSETDITERKAMEEEREKLITDLKAAMARIKTLSGLLPICMHCKKIRDDKGYWNQLEIFIRDHSEAEFSHGICPDCLKQFYPDVYDRFVKQNKKDGSDTGEG